MTGLRYERLVGLSYSHNNASGHAQWLFACDCGREIVADAKNVRRGNTNSCGCLHSEISAARLFVHGERAEKRHEATYRAWQAMKSACYNPMTSGFPRCGGRGIEVDARWRESFAQFLRDLGERPFGTVLKRLDPERDFVPGNCRWAPRPRPAESRARRQVGEPGHRNERTSEENDHEA